MQLRKCVVDVSSQRRLLALIATQAPCAATTADADADADTRFDEVLVYFHGFPDMAVHPTKLDFASRMPLKLAEAWLSSASTTSDDSNSATTRNDESQRDVAFVTFNFGGVPGSDEELRFTGKTISKEVEDAVAVCEFVRWNLLKEEIEGASSSKSRVHVVGLSTGAIIASLLRSREGVVDTIAVVAGLLDLTRGVEYDFSPLQLAQFERDGACWKEFYLPDGAPLPKDVEISFDGETKAEIEDGGSGDEGEYEGKRAVPSKIFVRLSKKYVDECRDESVLDIKSAVSSSSSSLLAQETNSHLLPPFLVIHGDADQNVPFHNGDELFSAASEPKSFLPIPKANHLLSNSKHLKRALKAILEHTQQQCKITAGHT